MASLPASYLQAQKNFLTLGQITQWSSAGAGIFVYGSLMLPSVAARRIAPDDIDEATFAHRMTPASITHHARLAVRDTPFCALVDQGSPDDTVHGFVIFGLTPQERGRVDRYEAGQYSREPVDVVIAARQPSNHERSQRSEDDDEKTQLMTLELGVETYIWAGPADRLVPVTETVWSLQDFLQAPEYRLLAG
ncbi:hypothetical protein MMC22_006099 [Lobaria immixta]|nr:hypothetical protein [Lobaria immixta]